MTENVESKRLFMNRNELLSRMIQGKVLNGYQIQVVTNLGDSYWGFVTGIDDSHIQLRTTGYGKQQGPGIVRYDADNNSLVVRPEESSFVLIPLTAIDAIHENGLSITQLTPESRAQIERHQRGIKKAAEAIERAKRKDL